MKIIIDIDLLKKYNLNINEYLTLLKIYYLSKDIDISFFSTQTILNELERKNMINLENNNLILTEKSQSIIKCEESDIDIIINYFKEVTGKRKIDSSSKSNRKFINDRLKQGYSVNDLKAVIDIKNEEWKNSASMRRYLRIETLFNQTKFQQYIGEVESKESTEDLSSVNKFRRI